MASLQIRIGDKTKKVWQEIAQQMGLTLSAWVRMVLTKAGREQINAEEKRVKSTTAL